MEVDLSTVGTGDSVRVGAVVGSGVAVGVRVGPKVGVANGELGELGDSSGQLPETETRTVKDSALPSG